MLGKWLWDLASNQNQLWARILTSKYGGWADLNNGRDRPWHSQWCKDLRKLVKQPEFSLIHQHMEWKVGDGSLVKFWKDKAIKAFNRALVIKWKWLMFHQPDQLWSRILISKYKGWRGLEEGSHKQTHSFWWSDLKSIMHHDNMAEVLKQFHWKLGSGDQILFWEDSWVGDGITLREKYPELYQISSQKFQLAGSMGYLPSEISIIFWLVMDFLKEVKCS